MCCAGTHGVSVANGCSLEAEELLVRSEPAQGIWVTGSSASVTLVKSVVKDCAWSAVSIADGASLTANGCEFSGARECMGLQAEGAGTNAKLWFTELSRNKGSGEWMSLPCLCLSLRILCSVLLLFLLPYGNG